MILFTNRRILFLRFSSDCLLWTAPITLEFLLFFTFWSWLFVCFKNELAQFSFFGAIWDWTGMWSYQRSAKGSASLWVQTWPVYTHTGSANWAHWTFSLCNSAASVSPLNTLLKRQQLLLCKEPSLWDTFHLSLSFCGVFFFLMSLCVYTEPQLLIYWM